MKSHGHRTSAFEHSAVSDSEKVLTDLNKTNKNGILKMYDAATRRDPSAASSRRRSSMWKETTMTRGGGAGGGLRVSRVVSRVSRDEFELLR